MENNFECYIGEPLEKVKKELEEKGYKVLLCENSLPKIKTDYKLVTLVKPIGDPVKPRIQKDTTARTFPCHSVSEDMRLSRILL